MKSPTYVYGKGVVDGGILDNAVTINDCCVQTCASAAEVHYDADTGLVYVTYLSSHAEYGESRDLVMLTIFPLTQPTNAKHIVVAENGVDGMVKPFEPNILCVSNTVFIYFRTEDGAYHYKTYSKENGELSAAINPMKLNNGTETVDLTDTTAGAYVTAQGGTVGTYHIHTCRITEHGGVYYAAISTYLGTAFIITSTDGITWEAKGTLSGTCQYEVQLAFIGETLVAIMRGADAIYTSTDYGATMAQVASQNTNSTRPQLVEYDGKILSVIGYGSEDATKAYAKRQRIRIKLGTDPIVNNNKTIMELYSEYGIVYPAIFTNGTDVYMIYSDSKRFWHKNNQAKDELRLVLLGDFTD